MADDEAVPSPVQANENSQDNAANPSEAIVPEVKIPPSHASYKITCDKKRDKWDIAKLVAEFVGLAFLILYTLYTAGIYCANRKAADAAESAAETASRQMSDFEAAQIARLSIENVQTTITTDESTKCFSVKLSYDVRNVGPTSAIGVDGMLSRGNGLVVNHNIECKSFPARTVPGLDYAQGFKTSHAGDNTTCGHLQEILNGSVPYTVLIQYSWRDIFGNPHETAVGRLYNFHEHAFNEVFPVCEK